MTPPFKTIPIFRRRALPFTTGRTNINFPTFSRYSESEGRKRDRPVGSTFLESCEIEKYDIP